MNLPSLSLPITGLLLAFIAHGSVAALLLRPGPGRQLSRAVGLACMFTALEALVAVLAQSDSSGWPRTTGLLAALTCAAWLNVLRVVALPPAVLLVRAGWGVCAAFALVAILLPDTELLAALRAGDLVLVTIPLVALAAIWWGRGIAPRESLTPLMVGLGLPLACGYFASPAWQAVVQTLCLPLILLGIRRVAAVEPLAFVSRQVVLFSLALVAVAGYVALTALAADAISVLDVSGSNLLEAGFVCAAAVLFGALCAARSVRRRIGVFVATHFYRNKYDYRLEWLRFIQTLSSGSASAAPARAILAVAQMFESPAGALYAREGATGRFERRAVWPSLPVELPESIDGDDPLPRFMAERQWVVEMDEYERDPGMYGGFTPPSWLDGRWHIVTPLLQQDALVGFIVLAAPPPPFRMTFEDRDLFKTVGRHIALQITQQNAERRLAEGRQFDAHNRFAAFVMHDLKNSVAQLQLVVQNAARHRHNPQFIDDAISTTANSVERMTGLLAQLQARDVQGHVSDVPFAPLVEAAVGRARERPPLPALTLAGAPGLVRADAEKLGAVIDHVIRNAQEAAGEQGHVRLALSGDAGRMRLVITDDGPGMDEEFVRESLFRPFHTTKGSRGMGIGAYQTREYVHSLGGSVEVQSSPGRGTAFCITLPACQTPSHDS